MIKYILVFEAVEIVEFHAVENRFRFRISLFKQITIDLTGHCDNSGDIYLVSNTYRFVYRLAVILKEKIKPRFNYFFDFQ